MSNIILSNDENVLQLLQDKISHLEEEQTLMKDANKHWRKNGTMKGFKDIVNYEEVDKNVMASYSWQKVPFPSFELTSVNNKIKTAKQRLESLLKLKEIPFLKEHYTKDNTKQNNNEPTM